MQSLAIGAAIFGLGLTLALGFWLISKVLRPTEGSDLRALRAETALEIAERELSRARLELTELQHRLTSVREEAAAQAARLDEARAQIQQERLTTSATAAQLRDTFQAIAGETLKGATEHFQRLAETGLRGLVEKSDGNAEQRQQAVAELVAPLKDALGRLSEEQRRSSESRASEAAAFSAEMQGFRLRSDQLSTETQRLVTALRVPHVRGRWGEIQLRRTAELSGMIAHCDFFEQESVHTEEGVRRPDMLVRLPRGREVVVDAKVPLTHYLAAIEATSEVAREEALHRHAQLVRTHVERLADKRYWDQFDGADFVVMFLPNEGLLSAALERDPALLERAIESKVMLTTPTSFVALLRVIAAGWREERLAENASKIAAIGRELYDRLVTLSSHFAEVGAGLKRTVQAYNQSVGSYQSRVLSQAQRLRELDAASERELPTPETIDELPRELN